MQAVLLALAVLLLAIVKATFVDPLSERFDLLIRARRVVCPATGLDGPATVAVIESLGHERQVGCRLADGSLVIVRASMDDAAPEIGAPVRIAIADGRLHVFDAAGGDRIEAA
jgi:ABC-type sugar transport system ATPase subunit